MQKHVYFVRHGESDANTDGIQRGGAERLTDKGKAQALQVADRIAAIGVDALISSTLPRAVETATAISERIGIAIETSPLFVERVRPSMLTGRTPNEPAVLQMNEEIFAGYLRDDDHRHSDEENLSDLRIRIRAALVFLAGHSAERLCVVSHFNFLRLIAAAVWTDGEMSGKDVANAFRVLQISNTGITYLRYMDPPRYSLFNAAAAYPWEIVSWNDSAHLG